MPTTNIPARLLAAFIDWLVTYAVFLALAKLELLPYDYGFLSTLFFGLIYFGISNSSLVGGQTLGKVAFGLEVIKYNSQSQPRFLSLGESVLRYLFTWGFYISLLEITPIYYRHNSTVTDYWQLQLPMLLANMLLLANLGSLFVHPQHRALHDIITGSIVVRKSKEPFCFPNIPLRSRAIIGPLAGACLAAFFWFVDLGITPELKLFREKQYYLESRYSLRFFNPSSSPDSLRLDAISLESYNDETLQAIELTQKLAEALTNTENFPDTIKTLFLSLYFLQNGDTQVKNPLTVKFNLISGRGELIDTAQPVERSPAS